MTKNFDENKLEVFHEEEIPVSQKTDLVGRVYSYDGGEKRIKVLSRVSRKNGTKRTIREFPPLTSADQVKMLTELLTRCSLHL